MSDRDDLYQALRNADAAGDTDGAQKLAAYIQSLPADDKSANSAPTQPNTSGVKFPLKIGAAGLPDALKSTLSDAGWANRNIAGMGSAVANAYEGLKGASGYVDSLKSKLNDAIGIGNINGGTTPFLQSDPDQVANQKIIADSAPVGNLVGNMMMLAPTAFIPGANTMTGAATIGALQGALLTPGDMKERAISAGLGGAGGFGGMALGKGASGLYGYGSKLIEPMTDAGKNKIIGQLLRKVSGDDVGNVISRMQGAQEIVPGSVPTAAEVAENGGIAALQRAMSAADPEAYTNRGLQSASARLNALRGVAGDDQAMQSAVNSRESAANSLYGQAFKSDEMRRDLAKQASDSASAAMAGGIHQGMPTTAGQITDDLATPGLRELATRPAFQSAVDSARTLSANMGEPISDPLSSLRGLHYVKLAIDNALNSGNQPSTLASYGGAALNGVKSKLLSEMESPAISPFYGNARKTFSDMSQPINQMQVGQELLGKMQGALGDHGALANETGAMYARALNDARGNLVKTATGGINRNLEDVMTPEQMGTLNAIAQDLARKSNAQNLGRGPGSNTFQNLAMDNLSSDSGIPSAVNIGMHFIPGVSGLSALASGLGKTIYKGSDNEMRTRLANALLDPKYSAGLMEAAGKEGGLSAVYRYLQSIPPIAGMALSRQH